jgi:c(7)-type cytochrome triheme protein
MNFFYFLVCLSIILQAYVPGASAVPIGSQVTYQGKGAGTVVFDGAVHAKSLACVDCHETEGLIPPLFGMKKYANGVSMRKIEMGLSCGKCHAVSMKDTSTCSTCHHK